MTDLKPAIDARDWSRLTLGDRIRQLEVEGYLVLPDLLSEAEMDTLRQQVAPLETGHPEYTVYQRTRPKIAYLGGPVADLVAHPVTIPFLKQLFGDELILMSSTYARSEPGHPGIALHTDGQPYGSEIFGFEGSVPVMVRAMAERDW